MNRSKFLILSLIIVVFCTMSCKGDKDKGNESITNTTEELGKEITPTDIDYAAQRGQAKSAIEFRIQNEGKDVSTAIEADVWHFEFMFEGKTMEAPQPFYGHWIDFKPDWTYEYGYFDEKRGAGKYHYSFDTAVVLMLDDNPEIKADEYDVRLAGDSMVLVGKATYDSNSKQCKLNRAVGMPTKK